MNNKHRIPRTWKKTMSAEEKADLAIYRDFKWVRGKTREEIINWYRWPVTKHYSKVVPAIMEAIRKEPGITQSEVYDRTGYTFGSGYINICLQAMFGKSIERVWDGKSFHLYLKGRAPPLAKKEPIRPRGYWLDQHPMNRAKGERFRMEFDEGFGLLYCDLKIIAGAAYRT